jgi:hypothetical protein
MELLELKRRFDGSADGFNMACSPDLIYYRPVGFAKALWWTQSQATVTTRTKSGRKCPWTRFEVICRNEPVE